jgi:putative transposase
VGETHVSVIIRPMNVGFTCPTVPSTFSVKINHWLTKSAPCFDMSCYRRLFHPGATYFFTVCLADRRSQLLTDDIAGLRHAYAATLSTMPVRTEAIVILPDHLHAIWTLPEGDADFPNRWRLIKTEFSKGHAASDTASGSKWARGEKGIWQRRYWEHRVRSEADLEAHIAYCWGNPVKHGLASKAVEWPYSSIHRDIRLGRVSSDWAGVTPDGDYGEKS